MEEIKMFKKNKFVFLNLDNEEINLNVKQRVQEHLDYLINERL